MTEPITTRVLLERLQRHYIKPGAPLPGGIFLPEVGWNPAGGAGGRDGGCDAIYVGFTSSSGRLLVGHELKVSRADWLNELNKPGKADAWADQCHQWWLVVSDPAIVHDGELPAGWGLMSPGPSKTRMKIHTAADTKRDRSPSWLAVRSIMARQDTLRAQAITAAADRQRDDLRKENQAAIEREVERRMRAVPDATRLRDQLNAVEHALGYRIDFDNQRWGRVGTSVALDDLAVIGKAAAEARSLRGALDQITAGYGLNNLRKAIDQAEQAITNIRALPGAQLELIDG